MRILAKAIKECAVECLPWILILGAIGIFAALFALVIFLPFILLGYLTDFETADTAMTVAAIVFWVGLLIIHPIYVRYKQLKNTPNNQ